jgi:predicted RNA binding protein YcfA (HicA-like mRNA interferase family)
MPDYPSMRWPELRRVLEREPLGYVATKVRGSHVKYESPNGFPPLRLAFHDRSEIPPGLVRKILTRDVGLTDEVATGLL